MSPSVVVVVEPWRKSSGAFVVVDEHLAVGPLVCEGAVEAFNFAVLPWAVRTDELVLDLMQVEEFV